jgi:hypothetical protein
MNFTKWINTFIEEKGLDMEASFEVEGPSGTNFFTYGVILEHILIAPSSEQVQIKNVIVKIDFANGDVLDFFRHLGKAIAA